MRKARAPTKVQIEIKSSIGKSPANSKTSINTQQESKEIFRKKILDKVDEIYDKIHTKVAEISVLKRTSTFKFIPKFNTLKELVIL